MALSNILIEPRRELIESAVGVALVALALALDIAFGAWLHRWAAAHGAEVPALAGCFVGLLATMLLFLLAHLTHWVGEGACDLLKRHGMEIRPKTRYARDSCDGKIKVV
jgi:hypothetical protein